MPGRQARIPAFVKVLIIQLKQIGDVVIASLLPQNLRRMYPGAELHFFVYETAAPVLWHNPNIDKLILLEDKHRRRTYEFLKLVWAIRQEQYDVVIDGYSKIESWITVFLSQATIKISYQKKWRQFLYTDHVARTPSSQHAWAIGHKLALLAPLQKNDCLDPVAKIYLKHQEQQLGLELLARHIPAAGRGKTLMLNILGSMASKTYPLHYMAQLLDHIVANYPHRIVLNYHPAQQEQALILLSYCSTATREKVNSSFVAGNLRHFIQLMSACDAIIGNEGGASHIAKALGKASFTLFSPAISKEEWATYADNSMHIALHLRDFKPDLFTGLTSNTHKEHNQQLYNAFVPEYIAPLLDNFLSSL